MMNKLAIAYVTCDKYSYVWDEWYDNFQKYFKIDLPKYFCGEEKKCPWDEFTQIPHKVVEVERWTTKLRAQIEQIPADYISTWMDDGIPQKNIDVIYAQLYLWLLSKGGDSMRIMYRGTKAKYNMCDHLDGGPIWKLAHDSSYRISFSPNIWKKEFLLEALQYDESPWECELNSWGKFPHRELYAYHISGWLINRIIQ